MMKSDLSLSDQRILESETDAVFAAAFRMSEEFCDSIRKQIGVVGAGCATRVTPQAPHHSDGGTIDLDVTLSDERLLIENKISAAWSFTRKGENQVDRYSRSASGYGALTVLLAPRTYLRSAGKVGNFDRQISYESLLNNFSDKEYELLCTAIDQAVVPVTNPDDARTAFFDQISSLMTEITPDIRMKMRDRNKDSFTVHLDVGKSLQRHVGLPTPSVFLQLRQANVKLMVRKWGWALERLRQERGLDDTGIRLERVGTRGTLAFQKQTPFVDCDQPFESQAENIEKALLTTRTLCRWWDSNEALLRRFSSLI
jgi:hypothetical protein